MPTAWWCSNNFLISCLQLKIFSTTLTTSTKQYNKKQNLPNQTYQAKFMKPNQTYQTKFTQTNLTTKLIIPNISNQTYQTKLPKQTYQIRSTKANLPNQTKHTKSTWLRSSYFCENAQPWGPLCQCLWIGDCQNYGDQPADSCSWWLDSLR